MASESPSRLAAALRRHAPHAAGAEPNLQAALDQLVAHPGKLVRARLVEMAARHHGLRAADALRLACAIEYFHTASLVLDDLPCMDDATLRRGLPCVHRQHGEATAILAALALINRAYSLIGQAIASQPRRVRVAVNACLDRCLGLAGLVGGQARDLTFAQTSRQPRDVGRIAAAKTGALFELAVLLPATLARPSRAERRRLRALCVYWGLLFQIADDLRDELASSFAAGKTTGRDRSLARPNFALALGLARARSRFVRLHAQSRRMLDALGSRTPARWSYLQAAADYLMGATLLPLETQSAAA